MERVELIVAGAGPAGLSAALVAHGNGARTVVLEAAPEVGGQVRLADHPITDVLGLDAKDGLELAERFQSHAAAQNLDVRTRCEIDAIHASDGGFVVQASGVRLHARAVVLATGAVQRGLGLENERELGVFDRARPLAAALAGQPVVIAGGGDEAASTAELLARAGAHVTIVVRRQLGARPLFVRSLLESGVDVVAGEQVTALEATGSTLEAVRLSSGLRLPAARCFVRIGVEPRMPPIHPAPARHPDGRVAADALGRTSVPGLYAAGDLMCAPPARYVAVACGTGVIAGRAAEERLWPA